jgi:hypothetical protein
MNKQMEELCLCALAQGYGKDLRPLYKDPIIDIGLYLVLKEILK